MKADNTRILEYTWGNIGFSLLMTLHSNAGANTSPEEKNDYLQTIHKDLREELEQPPSSIVRQRLQLILGEDRRTPSNQDIYMRYRSSRGAF